MTPLRQRMTEDMQVRNFSPHTQASYLQQVALFARHFRRSPDTLGPEEIRAYQIYLTAEKRLAPNSILTAVAALRFLYRVTLKRAWPVADLIPAPKKPYGTNTVPSTTSGVSLGSAMPCQPHFDAPRHPPLRDLAGPSSSGASAAAPIASLVSPRRRSIRARGQPSCFTPSL